MSHRDGGALHSAATRHRGGAAGAVRCVLTGVSVVVPILLRPVSGRSGTTFLMSLLATSPDIGFVRRHPYEVREITKMARRGPISSRKWRRFSRRWSDRRYYAEKAGHLDLDTLPNTPVRILNLVRDPRDVWASILDFDRKRGYYGFGRQHGQSRENFRRTFVDRVKHRANRMQLETSMHDAVTVKYEELVTDPHRAARPLSEWLGVDLIPEDVEEHPGHRTSPTTYESIGRWKSDVPEDEAHALTKDLTTALHHFNYRRT